MKEVWRSIPSAPAWAVSDSGRIKRLTYYRTTRVGRILKPHINAGGYREVFLNCTRKVHQLVLEAFCRTRHQGEECRHLNGNKTDNHLVNLCWGTRKENAADYFKSSKALKAIHRYKKWCRKNPSLSSDRNVRGWITRRKKQGDHS